MHRQLISTTNRGWVPHISLNQRMTKIAFVWKSDPLIPGRLWPADYYTPNFLVYPHKNLMFEIFEAPSLRMFKDWVKDDICPIPMYLVYFLSFPGGGYLNVEDTGTSFPLPRSPL